MNNASNNVHTWGLFVLGEVLRPIEFVGAGLIIGGVVIVNARVGQRPLSARTGAA